MSIPDIVSSLNTELFEQGFEGGDVEFIFSSNGFVDSVEFLGNRIWDSDSEPREWLELFNDYESLESYLRRAALALISRLKTIKL